ncbi:hypothetical protein GLOIN_2v1473755 [Rhizophagus irregularis DAOM 181602=DAOM 197198]|nr:hypothetical protein GLOIN_2v1473755 [Rhizophagus irregularis DAOM 181602=DAOM 197198]
MILEDRQQVFPLPIRDVGTMMKRLSYVNRRSPRNKSVTGRGILKYFVSLTLRDRNVHSSVIGLTTDSLWKSATSHERAEYGVIDDEKENEKLSSDKKGRNRISFPYTELLLDLTIMYSRSKFRLFHHQVHEKIGHWVEDLTTRNYERI